MISHLRFRNHETSFLLFAGLVLMLQACLQRESVNRDESFSVIFDGTRVGHLDVARRGDSISVNYDYKNNGRGPTIAESIRLNADGYPLFWKITGNTTFGNKIDEQFIVAGDTTVWTDATGRNIARPERPMMYLTQFGSPYAIAVVARAILNKTDLSLPVLPSGDLKLTKMETFKTGSDSATVTLTSYALSGGSLDPDYFVLDEEQMFFAYISPVMIVIRSGFEGEEKGLRLRAAQYAAKRYETMQQEFSHRYTGDIRIRNVRVFDPASVSLTKAVSVTVRGDRVLSIQEPDAAGENEVEIDGMGGTLVPGLYDMHAHLDDESAFLNVVAGVTSVRDMGNSNETLDSLIYKIEKGVVAGPRVTRLGFIEGRSPFSANFGILVENEQEALEAVSTYAEKGFYGVKLYNSMTGDWAPAIARKAHGLNLFVAGHVPAFSNANAMIKAGFDEMTHINQVMLGWVLKPDEDTRTLLRLTAMMRFPDLDLSSAPVKETLDLMVRNNVEMDPTLGIHEALMLSRNGEARVGTLDYLEHMPPNVQRGYKAAMANISSETEDKAYRLAFDKIVETLKTMRARGIRMIPGTDMGGAFTLHRELELYQQLGYTPAELLKLGSYDMAKYLGHEDRGSIEPGKLADFFLVPGDPTKDFKAIKKIAMVSRGGVFYFPTEIYPAFGIKPFTEVPPVKVPAKD